MKPVSASIRLARLRARLWRDPPFCLRYCAEMRPWLAAGIATIGAVVFAAAPAHAAELTVTDDTGDAVGRGLDITSAQVRNRDSAVVATVTFDRNVR